MAGKKVSRDWSETGETDDSSSPESSDCDEEALLAESYRRDANAPLRKPHKGCRIKGTCHYEIRTLKTRKKLTDFLAGEGKNIARAKQQIVLNHYYEAEQTIARLCGEVSKLKSQLQVKDKLLRDSSKKFIHERRNSASSDAVDSEVPSELLKIILHEQREITLNVCRIDPDWEAAEKIIESLGRIVDVGTNAIVDSLQRPQQANIQQPSLVRDDEPCARERVENEDTQTWTRVERKRRAPKRIVHAVVIKPSEHQSSEDTRKLIESTVDPVGQRLGIKRMAKIKDGGILLETETKSELDAISNELKTQLGSDVTVNAPISRKPRIINRQEVTHEELAVVLTQQNDELNEGDIKPRFSFIGHSGHNWVCSLSQTAFRSIAHLKRLKHKWQSVPFKPYEAPTQCFKCWRVGHLAKDCHNDASCRKCGATDGHKESNCKFKTRCSNCSRGRPTGGKSLSHRANDKRCPFLKWNTERLRRITDY